MSIKYAAAITGVGDVELENGKVKDGLSVLQVQAIAAKRALEDAGLTKDDVDGLFTSGFWSVSGNGFFPTLTLGEYLGIQPRYSDSTQVGGSSFESHVGHAAAAIKAGLCEVALIVYGSTARSQPHQNVANFSHPMDISQYEAPYGLPLPIGAYAMAAHRYMHEYGLTSEQLAEVAVSARKWASLNPAATKREPITVEDVVQSELIADPLHKLDCCLVTDGAGAIVLVSPERAKESKKDPIWLLGYGESHSHMTISSMPDLTVTPAAQSGKTAFKMAGVTHDDIDVVEVYDSFTITTLLTIESLGFCKPGEGASFFADGRTAPGGDFPLNTNGGGLSYAHPGMYGIFLLIEAVRQLRGECGERQVKNAELALVTGTGSYLSHTATCILGRD